MPRRTLAILALSLAAAAGAHAAQSRAKLQVWTDKSGVVHIEDPPPEYSDHPRRGARKAKSAKTQAQAKAPPKAEPHWWERATDAPPDAIDRAAAEYNVPVELIRAVIAVESAGDTSAVSHAGARGLMQLMPQTADHVYVADSLDPAQNIAGGTRYLRELANQFNGDMMLVLAAYNAGPEAVRKYNGVPPFAETRAYVRKVMAHYSELKLANAQRTQELASAAPAQGQVKAP